MTLYIFPCLLQMAKKQNWFQVWFLQRFPFVSRSSLLHRKAWANLRSTGQWSTQGMHVRPQQVWMQLWLNCGKGNGKTLVTQHRILNDHGHEYDLSEEQSRHIKNMPPLQEASEAFKTKMKSHVQELQCSWKCTWMEMGKDSFNQGIYSCTGVMHCSGTGGSWTLFFSGRDGFANRFSFADLPPHPHLHHHQSNEVLEWQPLA